MSTLDIIRQLEEKIKANEIELVKLDERANNLKEEKKKIIAELKELGIDAKDLEDTIAELEAELENDVSTIQEELDGESN
jgi:predicted  nucleic acid-binding Zn-ribbon protein